MDISSLATAINVRKLKLVMNKFAVIDIASYRLQDTLSHLSSLSLGGNLLPQNISTIQAPNLRLLSPQFDHISMFKRCTLRAITQFQLPLQDLEELRLI